MPRSDPKPQSKAVKRRTHCKSRHGCKQCKARHVRCDQMRPSCSKCVLRKVPCEYAPDSDSTELVPASPQSFTQATHSVPDDLPDFEERFYLDTWQYYMKMQQNNGHLLCLATYEVPGLLHLSVGYDYVRYAFMALWAVQNARISQSSRIDSLGREYRIKAFGLLQAALANFSEGNSDAVLGASLLLLYTCTDRSEERKLAGGVEMVVRAMQPWREKSILRAHLEQDTENIHPFAGKSILERTMAKDLLQQLKYLITYLDGKDDLVSAVKMLRHCLLNQYCVLRGANLPSRSPLDDVLRLWRHIGPATFCTLGEGDPDFLLVVAYFELVTGFMRSQWPGPSFAMPIVAKMRIIQSIHYCVETTAGAKAQGVVENDNAFRAKMMTYRSLMELPLQIATGFQQYGRAYLLT